MANSVVADKVALTRPGVCAVVVTFNPNLALLREGLLSLLPQVGGLVVVDNGSEQAAALEALVVELGGHWIGLGDNFGLGAAQNRGLEWGLCEGFEWLLLADQDTVFDGAFVGVMLAEIGPDAKAAAIAPGFYDSVRGEVGRFALARWWGFVSRPLTRTMPIAHGMASGLLLRAAAVREVGLMSEALFIDWVDLEWCWRARARGWRVLGTPLTQISHCIGERRLSFLGLGYTYQKPVRNYFNLRNCLFLALYCDAIRWPWRVFLGARVVKYVVFYPLLFKPRGVNLRLVFWACVDGVRAKLGRGRGA